MTVAKFDPDGNRLWYEDHGGNTMQIALTGGDDLYIGGDAVGGFNIRHLDQSQPARHKIVDSALHSITGATGAITGLSVMANGDVVSGTGIIGLSSCNGTLARWQSDLSSVWQTSETSRAFRRPIIELGSGKIVTQSINGANQSQIDVYSSSGTSLWNNANALYCSEKGESNFTPVLSQTASDYQWKFEDLVYIDSDDLIYALEADTVSSTSKVSVYDESGSLQLDFPLSFETGTIVQSDGKTVSSISDGFHATIRTYDETGTEIATYGGLHSYYNPNYIDSLGYVYLNKCGNWISADNANFADSMTMKLDVETLTLQWSIDLGASYRIKHVDGDGNLYALSPDFTTVKKFDSDGNLVWTKVWPEKGASFAKYGQVFKIVSDDDGNVYFAGERVRA